MNLRLLPWALLLAAVAVLAFRSPPPGDEAKASAAARGAGEGGLEIRLAPVDLREFHDDGGWNRLEAEEAVYSYGRKTVRGTGVVVSMGTGQMLKGSVIRADRALWDFDRETIILPDGGFAEREEDWTGKLTSATLDLDRRILRVPGEASLSGPGFSVVGRNLEWRWSEGKIAMDSPDSRIQPARLPGRRG